MQRSLLTALLPFVLTGYAVAGQHDWEVTRANKSAQILVPSTVDRRVSVTNEGNAGVVVQVKNGGVTTSITVNPNDTRTISVPAGAEVWVVRDGSDTHGCWVLMT
jgi:hypothetical protein